MDILSGPTLCRMLTGVLDWTRVRNKHTQYGGMLRMLVATLWMLHMRGSGATATAAQATYPLGFFGSEVNEGGKIKTFIDKYQEDEDFDCKPLAEYSSAELSVWLTGLGFDVNETAARMIDGRSLVAMTSAPNALSEDSTLFNLHLVKGYEAQVQCGDARVGVAASLVYLVERVQNSLTEPNIALPPFMDPCSTIYGTKQGSDVEVLSSFPFLPTGMPRATMSQVVRLCQPRKKSALG